MTEQDKQNVQNLVDIINRLPEEDKRVLEAYARGVIDSSGKQQATEQADKQPGQVGSC